MISNTGISVLCVCISAAALVCRAAIGKRKPKQFSQPVLIDESPLDIPETAYFTRLASPISAVPKATRHTSQTEIEWEDLNEAYLPQPIKTADFCDLHHLPKNIEIAEKEPFVLIDKSVFERIQLHLKSDISVEKGGLLIGKAFLDEQASRFLLTIHDAFEAHAGLETSSTLSYTTSTWEEIIPLIQHLPHDQTILGSYHSHPGMGVFLSSIDMETQTEIFNADWQIAMVVDPITNEVGFFMGREGINCERWELWEGSSEK